MILFKDLRPGDQFIFNCLLYLKVFSDNNINAARLATGQLHNFLDNDIVKTLDSSSLQDKTNNVTDSSVLYNKSSNFCNLVKDQCFIYDNLFYRKYDEFKSKIGNTNYFEGFHANDVVLIKSPDKFKKEYIASICEASATSTIINLKLVDEYGYIFTFQIPQPKEYTNIEGKFKINIEQF